MSLHQQMKQFFLPINEFVNEPYSGILGYPKATKIQLKARLKELKQLDIKSVSFVGPTALGKISVLGKGYAGVVVLAKKNNSVVALKIRRVDSQRKSLKDEAVFLKKANSVNVGPKLIAFSKNFLVMEYLPGEKIGKWIEHVNGKGTSKRVKNIIKKVLTDCYNLDKIGLDHGELSIITKHVIIGKSKVTIIDYESSSIERRTSNVTSATQGMLIGSGIAKKIQKIYRVPEKEEIISALREYKLDKSRRNFDNLLKVLKVSK